MRGQYFLENDKAYLHTTCVQFTLLPGSKFPRFVTKASSVVMFYFYTDFSVLEIQES